MFGTLKNLLTTGRKMTVSENEPDRSGRVGLDAKSSADHEADIAGKIWRAKAEAKGTMPIEIGGPKGLEPTRYGDWERAGRCVDF